MCVAALVVGGELTALPGSAYQRPALTRLVSAAPDGRPGNGNSGTDPGTTTYTGGAGGIAMTPDGRYVAFVSAATNLVAGGSRSNNDVYVRDLRTGRVTDVSVASDGSFGVGVAPKQSPAGGCHGASEPAISADGRYVAFSSCYTNLSSQRVTGLVDQIYVHDRRTGKTELVSVDRTGAAGLGSSTVPSISADGRYVAFQSDAPNLQTWAPGCPAVTLAICLSNGRQAYVRDLRSQSTVLASSAADGTPSDGAVSRPSISGNGRFLAFTSTGDDLAGNDTNRCLPSYAPSCPDVYVRDLKTKSVELASVTLTGQAPLGPGLNGPVTGSSATAVGGPSISADGRWVLFGSTASGLVPADNAVIPGGVYVRDRLTARTYRVSVDSAGGLLPAIRAAAPEAAISADGRFVTFLTDLPGSTASQECAGGAVHDALTGATELWPVTTSRALVPCDSNQLDFTLPVLSGDGRYLAFASGDSDLAKGDTNGKYDVFVADRGRPTGTVILSGVAGPASSSPHVALAGASVSMLRAASVARRTNDDLFVRLDLDSGLTDPLGAPGFAAGRVYGLDFTLGDAAYEVRAGQAPSGGMFGLWRQDNGVWRPVATLRGGLGTTGQQIVAVIPANVVGRAAAPGQITTAWAFARIVLGSTGTDSSIDQIKLRAPSH